VPQHRDHFGRAHRAPGAEGRVRDEPGGLEAGLSAGDGARSPTTCRRPRMKRESPLVQLDRRHSDEHGREWTRLMRRADPRPSSRPGSRRCCSSFIFGFVVGGAHFPDRAGTATIQFVLPAS